MYVDDAFVERYGHRWCHLLADSVEELHNFAATIGLSLRAFHSTARIPHYDITVSQRRWVLAKGVQPITVREGIHLTRHLASPRSVESGRAQFQSELFECTD